MNVLQVFFWNFGRGGVQTVIMDIVRNTSPDNKVDIILLSKEKAYYDDEFVSFGGSIYRITTYEGKNELIKKLDYYTRGIKIFFKMLKILRKNKYDVIHCHNEYENGICNLAAFLVGIKVRISHLHRADYKCTNLFNCIYHKILSILMLKFSTNIICCSENTKKAFFKKKQKEKIMNKVVVITNGIDLHKFNGKRKINKERCVLTNIGQFCDNKNQQYIIEMMPMLIGRINGIELNLVGFNEDYKLKLEQQIKTLNVQKYVKILPPNTNIPEILSKTDLFIFPSKTEGFGMVLLEAQAMNVPCLVSDTVTNEVNVGLIKYNSLKESKEKWVKDVVDIYTGKIRFTIDKEKLKSMDVINYIKKIENIYKCGGKRE